MVEYLLDKETITGGEMVAIIEGRDPALVEDAYASTHSKARLSGDIEPPARNVHMVSEPVAAPEPEAVEEDGAEESTEQEKTDE